MKLQMVSLVLFFTCIGASSLSSGHLDFMAGAKKENILHLKDPRTEIKDFAEAFKEVASSEEKIKTTFRILNRPNDSRFKLDLMLIISQMDIMDNESSTFESKEAAWAVLQPLLEKYDKNFTYPGDYDVLSGEFIEIIVDDWLDRYTQEKVVRKSSKKDEEVYSEEGSGRMEILETSTQELKSLMDGSGSFDEYLRSLDREGERSEVGIEHGTSTEDDESASSEATLYYSTEQDGASEGYELHSTEESAMTEGYELHSTEDESSESVLTEGYDVSSTEAESAVTGGYELHSTDEESASVLTEGYDAHTTEDESEAEITEGYELHYTTGEDEVSSSTEGYEIATHSADAMESSTEYRLVGTTEDGQAVIQSTTEYYIPNVEHEVVDVQMTEDSVEEVSEDDGSLAFKHRSGFIVVDKKPLRAGSIRGIPGVHFPDYDEIPITSFSCADKKYIPGFYADLETGCQVFHVCWPHRRESFLCPIGTLFNQALLSCDYWYSTNCSLSPLYYDVNNQIREPTTTTPRPVTHKPHPKIKIGIKVTKTPKSPRQPEPPATPTPTLADVDWAKVLRVLPIKSKVFIYPQSSIKSLLDKDIGHFVKTEQGKAMKEAISKEIVGKILNAAETLAKKAVRTLPIKYEPKKPGQVPVTKKPGKVFVTKTPKVHTTAKPEKVHIPKLPPKIIERFVVKPSVKKFDSLKPLLAGKFATSPKVGKQQAVQKVMLVKEHIPDVLLGAMEKAGTVLQKNILPLTRMALVESSLKHSKAKWH